MQRCARSIYLMIHVGLLWLGFIVHVSTAASASLSNVRIINSPPERFRTVISSEIYQEHCCFRSIQEIVYDGPRLRSRLITVPLDVVDSTVVDLRFPDRAKNLVMPWKFFGKDAEVSAGAAREHPLIRVSAPTELPDPIGYLTRVNIVSLLNSTDDWKSTTGEQGTNAIENGSFKIFYRNSDSAFVGFRDNDKRVTVHFSDYRPVGVGKLVPFEARLLGDNGVRQELRVISFEVVDHVEDEFVMKIPYGALCEDNRFEPPISYRSAGGSEIPDAELAAYASARKKGPVASLGLSARDISSRSRNVNNVTKWLFFLIMLIPLAMVVILRRSQAGKVARILTMGVFILLGTMSHGSSSISFEDLRQWTGGPDSLVDGILLTELGSVAKDGTIKFGQGEISNILMSRHGLVATPDPTSLKDIAAHNRMYEWRLREGVMSIVDCKGIVALTGERRTSLLKPEIDTYWRLATLRPLNVLLASSNKTLSILEGGSGNLKFSWMDHDETGVRLTNEVTIESLEALKKQTMPRLIKWTREIVDPEQRAVISNRMKSLTISMSDFTVFDAEYFLPTRIEIFFPIFSGIARYSLKKYAVREKVDESIFDAPAFGSKDPFTRKRNLFFGKTVAFTNGVLACSLISDAGKATPVPFDKWALADPYAMGLGMTPLHSPDKGPIINVVLTVVLIIVFLFAMLKLFVAKRAR